MRPVMLGCPKTKGSASEACRYSILFHPDEERIPEGRKRIQKREKTTKSREGQIREKWRLEGRTRAGGSPKKNEKREPLVLTLDSPWWLFDSLLLLFRRVLASIQRRRRRIRPPAVNKEMVKKKDQQEESDPPYSPSLKPSLARVSRGFNELGNWKSLSSLCIKENG